MVMGICPILQFHNILFECHPLPGHDRTRWSLVVERLPVVRELVGLFPGRVIPKTLRKVIDASLLSDGHLKDRSRTYSRFPVVDCKM